MAYGYNDPAYGHTSGINISQGGHSGGDYSTGASYLKGPNGQPQVAGVLGRFDVVDPRMYAADLQQSRFNTVFPWLQGQFGSIMGGMANSGVTTGSGPQITASQVWTPDQVQQQVNQSRAHTDMQTAGMQRQSQNQVAGRGLGADSPLSMALSQGYQNQGMATNAANTTGIRLGAAEKNAGQLLASQTARSNAFNQQTANQIEARKPYFNLAGQLFGSLAGLVGLMLALMV